jgi:hypothetical protein
MARNDTWLNRTSTVVDPYRRAEIADDDLLHTAGFENTSPLGREPNPVTQLPTVGPEPDLSSLLAADEKLPVTPVIGEGTGSYIEDAKKAEAPAQAVAEAAAPKMFSPHYTMDQWNKAIADQQAATAGVAQNGETAQSRLVSAAPDWYKGGKPPGGHSGWADAATALGGALAAGPNQRLKDPNRSPLLKQRDAQQAATATGLSTLFSNLFNHGQQDYKTNQDAALKEAQMQRSLPGGKTTSQIKLEGANKTIEQMQRDGMLGDLAGHRSFQEGIEKAKHDVNNPEVQAMIQTLVKAGRGTPEELAGLTYDGLVHLISTLNQRNSADAVAANAEAGAINSERKAALEHGYKTQEQYDKEQQEENRRRDESGIPGIEWNGAPPSRQVVDKMRETSAKATTFINRLDRMTQIQKELNDLGVGWHGPINEWLGNPKVKELQNEAARLQDAIGFAIRSADYGNFGVPQQWEALKVAAMAPQAGTPTGYLRGAESWKAISDDVKRMWADHVHYSNAHFPGEKGHEVTVSGDRPAPEAPHAPARAAVHGGKVVQTDEMPATGATPQLPGATPPNAADQAKIDTAKGRAGAPAPAPTPAPAAPKLEAGQKMYKVTYKTGKTEESAIDPKIAARLATDHPDQIASVVEM